MLSHSSEDFEEVDTYIGTLAQMADDSEISMEKINAAVTRHLLLCWQTRAKEIKTDDRCCKDS